MYGNKNKIDKFGYEYKNIKIIGRGTYGIVWLSERDGRIAPNPFCNLMYDS
jgi:hypothetical protein